MLIVKPVKEQRAEITKKDIKSKVDINRLSIGVTKFKDTLKGSVVIGCNNVEER